MSARGAVSALAAAVILIFFLLFLYFPAVPRTTLGWAALIVFGIPLWIFLEWLGDVVLGSSFFARRSSIGRVLLAIPAVAVLLLVSVALIRLVQWAIVSL